MYRRTIAVPRGITGKVTSSFSVNFASESNFIQDWETFIFSTASYFLSKLGKKNARDPLWRSQLGSMFGVRHRSAAAPTTIRISHCLGTYWTQEPRCYLA